MNRSTSMVTVIGCAAVLLVAIWWSDGPASFTVQVSEASNPYRPFAGDFDGDGRADIFWLGAQPSNRDFVWYFNAGRTHVSKELSVSDTRMPVPGDFDGNGTTDVYWF